MSIKVLILGIAMFFTSFADVPDENAGVSISVEPGEFFCSRSQPILGYLSTKTILEHCDPRLPITSFAAMETSISEYVRFCCTKKGGPKMVRKLSEFTNEELLEEIRGRGL